MCATNPTNGDLGARSAPAFAIDRGLELALVHVRAPADVEALRVVVELLPGPAPRARTPRALAAATARRDVARRRPRALPGLAGPRALLLHGPRRDLLRPALGSPLAPLASLDVFVLASSLRALL